MDGNYWHHHHHHYYDYLNYGSFCFRYPDIHIVCEALFEDLLELGSSVEVIKEAFIKARRNQEKLPEKHPDNKHISAQEWDNFLNMDDVTGAIHLSKDTRNLHSEIVAAILSSQDD